MVYISKKANAKTDRIIKTQSIRYGCLVAVMCGKKGNGLVVNKLKEDNFIIIHMQSNSKK